MTEVNRYSQAEVSVSGDSGGCEWARVSSGTGSVRSDGRVCLYLSTFSKDLLGSPAFRDHPFGS